MALMALKSLESGIENRRVLQAADLDRAGARAVGDPEALVCAPPPLESKPSNSTLLPKAAKLVGFQFVPRPAICPFVETAKLDRAADRAVSRPQGGVSLRRPRRRTTPWRRTRRSRRG